MAYLGQTQMGQGTAIPMKTVATPQGNMQTIDINALVGMLVDQRKDYVYDTLKFQPNQTVASTAYRMFQNPIGQGDIYNNNQVKTEQETNMRGQGQFTGNYDFILNNIGFYILAGAEFFDISQFANLCWFEFKILAKTMWMGHIQRHPSGMGFTGMTTVSGQQNWLNGIADPKAIWWFGDWKKYIPPLTQFTLNINFTETYQQYYSPSLSTTTFTGLPSSVRARLFDNGVLSSTATLPTFLPQGAGGNGLQLLAILNGISNGPVQKAGVNGVDGDPAAVNRLGSVTHVLSLSSSNGPCI